MDGDDSAQPARVTLPLVGRKEAVAAQAELPAPRDLTDLGLEAGRAAVARGRLCGALFVECDEESSGMKRGGAARQEAPVGNSRGSTMRVLRATITGSN